MVFGKIISGSSRKAKAFSFKPRYYNSDKEEMKERYARIEAELNGKSSFSGSGETFRLRDKWKDNKKTSNFEKKSNIRLVFIVVILFALCYWLFYI